MDFLNFNSGKTQKENFWKLGLLGIKENEPSVCKKVLTNIKFRGNCYFVTPHFQGNVACVSDNYQNSLNCFNELSGKLNHDAEMFRKYDNAIQEQLKSCIMEQLKVQATKGSLGIYLIDYRTGRP